MGLHIAVGDADAAAARAVELGGAVAAGPTDVGDAGRMAGIIDPEGATFFVWEAGPVDAGSGARMVYLPGYGGHLTETDPGLRERMADLGAPERFEDVVAWIAPLADGLRPHWDVTFGVADADAAAARALERGGPIVLPPTDMPWVRLTVISDPEGATFTASRFMPPGRGG